MLGIFVLIAFGLLSWWTLWWTLSRGPRFDGFARLIDGACTDWGFERGRLTRFVSGSYRDRPVTLQLFNSHDDEASSSPATVVVTMKVRAPESEAWRSSLANLSNPDLSRATFDLEGRYGLVLTLRDGALKASCRSAPGWMFSGRFDEKRWRNVLAQMHVVAEWLERRAESGT